MDVQFRSRVLNSMPVAMQDHVLNQYDILVFSLDRFKFRINLDSYLN